MSPVTAAFVFMIGLVMVVSTFGAAWGFVYLILVMSAYQIETMRRGR